jgi:hypothetical protein
MKLFSPRAAVRAGVLAVAAGTVLSVFGASAAFAAPRAGDAVITTPTGTTLNTGAQNTPWTIKLPPAAACTGNTATGGYHVFGFVAPAGTDPGTLTFDALGPSAPALPLFDQAGTQYGPANTAVSPPGQITQIPVFDWMKFTSADLPTTGNPYRVGIACANNVGAGDKYWDVAVTFTSTLGWTAANPQPVVPESPLTVALPLSAVALLGGAVIVLRRRQMHGATPIA